MSSNADMKFLWCFNSETNAHKCAALIESPPNGGGSRALVKRATDIGAEVGWDLCAEAATDAHHEWLKGFAYAFVCLTPGEDP